MADLDTLLRNSGLDRYDRNARIYPALLCLLPVLAIVALWFPPAWTLLGGLVSLAVSFGAIYWLAQIVRYQGRKTEKKLGARVGRSKTASLLAHSNTHIPSETKARYYDFMKQRGVYIPDADTERKDPNAANGAFLSAVDWLLVHFRQNARASGLLNENIAYGFRRNMLGMKPAALIMLVVSIAINALLIWRGLDPDRVIAAEVIELVMSAALIVWIFIIKPDFVEDASETYAKRFLEQCEPKKAIKLEPQKAGS